MSKSSLLRSSDLTAIHALIQECREMGDAGEVWRRHLFARLAQLCGAELVVGGEVKLDDGRAVATHSTDLGWENGFNKQAFIRTMVEYSARIDLSLLITAYLGRYPTGGEGKSRGDLIRDADWYSSDYFRHIQRPMGIDNALLSYRPLPGGGLSGINLCRGIGSRRDFSGRARGLLTAAHAAIVPLLGGPLAGFTEPSPTDLPPRVRQVLGCLLEGESDKQIATRLDLSKFTVNQYVKVIFAHFVVSSRPELLARWIRRGWGIRRAWLPNE